jgi:hypothetical protein
MSPAESTFGSDVATSVVATRNAAEAGRGFKHEKLDPQVWLQAMIASFDGDEKPLGLAIE